ncbi:transposase [Actinomyces slackii]|uniref:transposase n=1 Tax=Actinomyces slackii TaxID=52774 RepID=UPI00146F972F|nr:transposase [Actinomyces slackii]
MVNGTGLYPRVGVQAGEVNAVGLAGAGLVAETIRAAGLGLGLSRALEPWRRDGAVHDPGKIVCDLALSLALGGDCVSDLALLRGQAEVFGPVASVPTVSRLVGDLAKDVAAVERAVARARARARARVWKLAGEHAPGGGRLGGPAPGDRY